MFLTTRDAARLPRDNLQRILQIALPSKRDALGDEGMAIECGICYTFLHQQAVPEVTCESAACARCFHTACLVNWLQALPTTRHSYQTLFGQCPYCQTGLSVTNAAAAATASAAHVQ